jgi:hypothetical protein
MHYNPTQSQFNTNQILFHPLSGAHLWLIIVVKFQSAILCALLVFPVHVTWLLFVKELQVNGTAFSAARYLLFPLPWSVPRVSELSSEFHIRIFSILVLISQGNVSLRTETTQGLK